MAFEIIASPPSSWQPVLRRSAQARAPLFENRLHARRRRKAEVAACDDCIAPAVQREQLALARLRTAVDILGIANRKEQRPAFVEHARIRWIGGEIVQLLRVARKV